MFTDIAAAIEEARYLMNTSSHHHAVVQSSAGVMLVRLLYGLGVAARRKVMFSTDVDGMGVVIPEVR
ncbi:hypothetical protein [Morganella morganii]|uniref:hypothetical protein n=1 Tax=Morganella morganii TaxID=582 RepID=UPI0023DDCCAB|nr:hypothetical protein [Morganella morganii]MDF2407557.1 hypothetical protein [Morganella morganii]